MLSEQDNTPEGAVLCELGFPHHFVQTDHGNGILGAPWYCVRCGITYTDFRDTDHYRQAPFEYSYQGKLMHYPPKRGERDDPQPRGQHPRGSSAV